MTSGVKAIDYLSMAAFNYVLSFNYTNTYERLYGNKETEYCYIHGLAQDASEKSNMILGIDDSLPKEQVDRFFVFAKFKKYFQRISFKTGSQYRNWIKDIIESKPRVISERFELFIVGHSMGATDHDILREFLNLTKYGVVVNIYYHNEQAKINLIEQTIRIMTKETLIERVHGEDSSTIRFIDQYDEEKGLFRKNSSAPL